jgi:hypothetical protein
MQHCMMPACSICNGTTYAFSAGAYNMHTVGICG